MLRVGIFMELVSLVSHGGGVFASEVQGGMVREEGRLESNDVYLRSRRKIEVKQNPLPKQCRGAINA